MITDTKNTDTKIKRPDVLIVEDELDICYLLDNILKRKNFKTSFVTSLQAAKSQLNTQNPDILIIDNHLPDGLGMDFIGTVKQTHPAIKIVMITAHDTLDDRNKALKRGADYFIGKPFTTRIIIETVEKLLTSP